MKDSADYRQIIHLVVGKFRYDVLHSNRGLEFDDLRQQCRLTILKVTRTPGYHNAANKPAYIAKAIYRELRSYIAAQTALICVNHIDSPQTYDHNSADYDTVYSAVESLTKVEREVINLIYYNEITSYAAVGKLLSKSYQTVQQTHNRAIHKLRRLLTDVPRRDRERHTPTSNSKATRGRGQSAKVSGSRDAHQLHEVQWHKVTRV